MSPLFTSVRVISTLYWAGDEHYCNTASPPPPPPPPFFFFFFFFFKKKKKKKKKKLAKGLVTPLAFRPLRKALTLDV